MVAGEPGEPSRLSDPFIPNASTAAAAAARVVERLDESVRAIAEALAKAGVERVCGPAGGTAGLGLGTRAAPAEAYAAYFDLLDAVLADDVARAETTLAAFHAALDAPAPPFMRGWDELDQPARQRLMKQVNSDATTRVVFVAPSEESEAAARAAVDGAMALFDRAAPEISDEIRAIIREVILVAGTVNETERFDGASSFSSWGALFLNADEHRSRIDALDGLSHESAHSLLFGRSMGMPFVENPPEERHPSPLRTDLRPLDGIFHATFVSARMHYAHSRVLGAGVLEPEEEVEARQRLIDCARAFSDGEATLRRHARLTPLGDELLSAASAYMADAAKA